MLEIRADFNWALFYKPLNLTELRHDQIFPESNFTREIFFYSNSKCVAEYASRLFFYATLWKCCRTIEALVFKMSIYEMLPSFFFFFFRRMRRKNRLISEQPIHCDNCKSKYEMKRFAEFSAELWDILKNAATINLTFAVLNTIAKCGYQTDIKSANMLRFSSDFFFVVFSQFPRETIIEPNGALKRRERERERKMKRGNKNIWQMLKTEIKSN